MDSEESAVVGGACGGPEPNVTALPLQQFFIRYHTNFHKGQFETGTLTLRHGSPSVLQFDGCYRKDLPVGDLRWIAKYQYSENPKKFCLIISVRDASMARVKSLFISPCSPNFDVCQDGSENDLQFSSCYDALMDFYQKRKFVEFPDIYPSQIDRVVQLIKTQPIFQGHVSLRVSPIQAGETPERYDSLMLIDLECVLWYGEELDTPTYHAVFWKESTMNSVESVKIYHQENEMQLETSTMMFGIPVIPDVQQNLKNLKPKIKDFMCAATALVDAAYHLTISERSSDPTVSGARSRSRLLEAGSSSGMDPSMQLYHTGQSSLRTLKTVLDEIRRQYFNNETLELQWVTVRTDIEDILSAGIVPLSDAGSGGLDPNNEHHFERAMSDVEDQLRDNNLPVAISRMQATRETFQDSTVRWIQELLRENDLELLKCLYFKYLCT